MTDVNGAADNVARSGGGNNMGVFRRDDGWRFGKREKIPPPPSAPAPCVPPSEERRHGHTPAHTRRRRCSRCRRLLRHLHLRRVGWSSAAVSRPTGGSQEV